MALDPLKRPLNRAEQLKTEPQYHAGIRLYDIDLAVANHMMDTVVPTVESWNEKIKIPVLYGNPERYKAIRKDGYLRDKAGMVQVPLIMFKRNSIARDDSIPNTMNRNLFYPSMSKYSKKHRYDRFSAMTGTQRPVEQYNITIPDYVNITYEVMIWTDFTEHMNKVVEAFQYATDEYWGDKDGYKFRTKIDSFDNTTEIGDQEQRIVRTTFTMAVYAYLLPEKFDNEPTTKKSLSPKKVVWGVETDLTGRRINMSDQSMYNEYSDVIDFMSIRGSEEATYVSPDTVKLTNVKLPKRPPELADVITDDDYFRVYINGVFIKPEKYEYTDTSGSNEIQFTFDTGSLSPGGTYPDDLVASTGSLGYIIEPTDEVGITGKFIEL
jgi:hypothetical protein